VSRLVCGAVAVGLAATVLAGPLAAATPGEIRWFDLVSEDAEKASRFYADLLGWTIEPGSTGTWVALRDGVPIAGISQIEDRETDVDESTWLAAIEVDNLSGAIAAATKLGAEVIEPLRRVKGYGSYAVIREPGGAPAMLVATERALGGTIGASAWVWAELWTHDLASSSKFYASVVGYERSDVDRPKGAYPVFAAGDELRAGLVEIEDKRIDPAWAPYIGVGDLAKTLAQARRLGGEVLLEPGPELGRGRVALLADPVGAAFFVYALDKETE